MEIKDTMTDMPAGILHLPERAHSCSPPEIMTFAPPEGAGPPTIDRWLPTGTVWECPCSRVWVVVRVPARQYGTRMTVAHDEWRLESRRERRRRLGLRWWQKETK